METRVGILELSIPRVRHNSFSTDSFERYQRREQVLIPALMETVVDGIRAMQRT
ncbi:MAG: hypothetical protein GX162_05410 [Firmicutes bacterium]|nr:hypothetical protein [Bacillota bacterium]